MTIKEKLTRAWRAWRIKRLQKSARKFIALIDKLTVKLNWNRQDRRQLWREVVSKKESRTELFDNLLGGK